jgi:hypothetical protein
MVKVREPGDPGDGKVIVGVKGPEGIGAEPIPLLILSVVAGLGEVV